MEKTPKRITVPEIIQRKGSTSKISCLTAYDFTFAKLLDAAGIDIILVGDSLGTVVQGHTTTIPVTLEQIIYHTQCVNRGVCQALVVADMPFLSYQVSVEDALQSAGRLIKEGGAAAVKLEGGIHVAEAVKRLVDVDIPVMGHVGLTPQSYHRMGGYKVQGRGAGDRAGARERVIQDAISLEQAGAFAVVLESVPMELAAEITALISVPTIGIGAGATCDGQILVVNDLLGLNPEFSPRFVKQYANLASPITAAVKQYISEVKSGSFPSVDQSFSEGESSASRRKPSTRKRHLRGV